MYLAYVKGPPVAVFAGSWLCVKSPLDGTPMALGEPLGDCDPAIARFMSIATSVKLVKQTGVKVFVSKELGEDGVNAAYAGGADGVLEELAVSIGNYGEGTRYVLLETSSVEELVNTIRKIAEVVKKPFDVLAASTLEIAPRFAPYVDGIFLKGGWVEIEVEVVRELPEVSRCVHCGVDYLMYGEVAKRCMYCGRRLTRVITEVKPPRSRAVFRAVYKRYRDLSGLRWKVV